MQITTQNNDTVDEICWRIFGRSAGISEQVYDNNMGLAELGPVLPDGVTITLPEFTESAPKKREIIQLWS